LLALRSRADHVRERIDAWTLLKANVQLSAKFSRQVEQYKQLAEKYAALVRSAQTRNDGSLMRVLAAWALRKNASAFALVGADGQISATNAAFLALDRGDPCGEPWRKVGLEGASPSGYADLRRLASAEAQHQLHTDPTPRVSQYVRGSQMVIVSVERSPSPDSGYALVMIRDVTDLAEARALKAAMEAKFVAQENVRTLGGLAMGIVHDLNNVIGSLAMRFDVLQRDPVVRAVQERNLQLMSHIIRSCTARIRTLHSVARTPDPACATFDVRDVVLSAVEILESGFLHGSENREVVRIQVDLPTMPAVLGAADELRHVIINLLVNARDAMPKGGTVTISGTFDGAAVRVFVDDEGPGIPPEHLERIFEPFFTTKGAAGTGVGLAMAKDVLARIGGSIGAHNRESGGARFELRFVTA
jgi:signal transduction histidine kinase